MKVAFVALLFVVGVFGRAAISNPKATGPDCPIPDPLEAEAGPLNITLEPVLVINQGGLRGALVALGLSTLNFTYDVNAIALSLEFAIDVKTLDIRAPYSDVTGWIDCTPFRQETLPSGDFEGAGDAVITGKNVHADISASLFVNIIGNKVTLRTLNINAAVFDEVTLDFSAGFLLNGQPIDWAAHALTFKANFDTDLAANKQAITDKIRTAANVIIGQYTIEELLELIGNIGGGVGEGCPPEQ